MIIAIDGPAGSGKSTVARRVAKALGCQCVDTGAMYRAITWKALKEKIDLEDETRLAQLTEGSQFRFFENSQNQLSLELDGMNVSQAIREQQVSEKVSVVSQHSEVRKAMVKWQRRLASGGNAVVEGRDIGTVVFPDADHKFFLSARLEARVQRRYQEQKQKERGITLEAVSRELHQRDEVDRHRQVSPLTKAPDAIYINTTSLTADDVVQKILQHVR